MVLEPEVKEILLTAQTFRHLNLSELDKLIDYCQINHFPAGTTILHQSKRGNGMYIIIKGSALITAKVLGKKELNLATLTHGNFVGESILIQQGLCGASVIASNDLHCLFISISYFNMLSLAFPEIKYKISKAITEEICERIKITSQHIKELMDNFNMTTHSLLSEVAKSLHNPTEVDYETMKIDVAQLSASDFFKCFTQQEYKELLQNAVLINAPKNCALLKEGETNSPFYIVLRGAVQVGITQNGKFAKLAVLGPMEIFGNMFFIDQTKSLIAYTSCERAILLKISEKNLEFLKNNHTKLWYKLFDFICKSFVSLEAFANKLLIRLNSELYNR